MYAQLPVPAWTASAVQSSTCWYSALRHGSDVGVEPTWSSSLARSCSVGAGAAAAGDCGVAALGSAGGCAGCGAPRRARFAGGASGVLPACRSSLAADGVCAPPSAASSSGGTSTTGSKLTDRREERTLPELVLLARDLVARVAAGRGGAACGVRRPPRALGIALQHAAKAAAAAHGRATHLHYDRRLISRASCVEGNVSSLLVSVDRRRGGVPVVGRCGVWLLRRAVAGGGLPPRLLAV
mgnify:CR=1 FL=1